MGNIFADVPDNLQSEVFESLVKSKNCHVERIISRGQSSPVQGWYDQDQSEWVIVLKGHAIILYNCGSEFQMKAGDYLNIKPHQKHRVKWTDPLQETIWLAIHY